MAVPFRNLSDDIVVGFGNGKESPPISSCLVIYSMIKKIRRFVSSDDGATAVEYAVLLALILMGVIGAIGTVGSSTGGLWGDIDSQLGDTTFGG